MSILDKLKSVFVVEDASKSEAKNPEKSTTSTSTEKSDSPAYTAPSVNYQGQVSEKFYEILAQVLEKNNLPGFDYLEYKKAVLSVAKLQNLDESGQFRTAYAAAQSMGVQPSHLIDSAKKYLSILALEEQNFNQSATQFLNTQISTKEGESTQLKQGIKQKEEQILQLQKELEIHKKRLFELESELKLSKTKVDTNKLNFKVAYQKIVDQIHADVQKMEQYLK